jgi:hypothetical protein
VQYTTTSDSDGTGLGKSWAKSLEAEVAHNFEIDAPKWKKLPGRAYLRFFWQSEKARDPLLGFSTTLPVDISTSGILWTFNGGVSISFF